MALFTISYRQSRLEWRRGVFQKSLEMTHIVNLGPKIDRILMKIDARNRNTKNDEN
jgi:hypothetical protein